MRVFIRHSVRAQHNTKPCGAAAHFHGKSLLAEHGGRDKAPSGPAPSLSLLHKGQDKRRRNVSLSFWMALEIFIGLIGAEARGERGA